MGVENYDQPVSPLKQIAQVSTILQLFFEWQNDRKDLLGLLADNTSTYYIVLHCRLPWKIKNKTLPLCFVAFHHACMECAHSLLIICLFNDIRLVQNYRKRLVSMKLYQSCQLNPLIMLDWQNYYFGCTDKEGINYLIELRCWIDRGKVKLQQPQPIAHQRTVIRTFSIELIRIHYFY